MRAFGAGVVRQNACGLMYNPGNPYSVEGCCHPRETWQRSAQPSPVRKHSKFCFPRCCDGSGRTISALSRKSLTKQSGLPEKAENGLFTSPAATL
jgi:hypothetical protein